MKRIRTNNAPSAIGTYSQGTIIDKLIFTSGQIGINPLTGKLDNMSFKDEVLRVLENIRAVIESCGGEVNHIVKLTVFIKDLSKFDQVNDVFATYFNSDFPARSLVEVSDLPGNANIEIEAIAEVVR